MACSVEGVRHCSAGAHCAIYLMEDTEIPILFCMLSIRHFASNDTVVPAVRKSVCPMYPAARVEAPCNYYDWVGDKKAKDKNVKDEW